MIEAVENDLLATIAGDLDSVEPRLVYADWLQSRGDLRGELAMVQHRLASRPHDFILQQRFGELDGAIRPGILAGVASNVLGPWWLGFIDGVTLHRRLLTHIRSDPDWFEHPALRFVRSLHQPVTDLRAWDMVSAWRHRGSVRSLQHGTVQTAIAPRALAAIAEQLPALATLDLRAESVPHPEAIAGLPLRALRLEVATFDARGAEALFAAPWPLARLAIRAPAIDVAALEPLLSGACLRGVQHLEISGVSALAVVERLAAAGRLGTLSTLALPFVELSAGDCARLARYRDALAPVRLAFPLAGSVRDVARTQRFAVLLDETLRRPTDALAAFESNPIYGNDGDSLRAYAAALRHSGDRERMLDAFDFLKRSARVAGTHDDRASLALSAALLAGHDDPALAELHALSLLADGRRTTAIEAASRLPPSDMTRLISALASRQAPAIDELIERAASAPYAALGWLLDGRFGQRVPSSCITPDDILGAIAAAASLSSDPSERLDCAEIAIVAAVQADELAVAAARTRALGALLEDRRRRWNHALRVVFAVIALDRWKPSFVSALVHATRDQMAGPALAALTKHYLEP